MNYLKIVLHLRSVILVVSELPLRSRNADSSVIQIPILPSIPRSQVGLLGQSYDFDHPNVHLTAGKRKAYRKLGAGRGLIGGLIGSTLQGTSSALNGAYRTYRNLKKMNAQVTKAALKRIYKMGNTMLEGAGDVLHGVSNFAGEVRQNAKAIAQKGVSLLGSTAKLTMKVGNAIIMPPLRGIERTLNLAHSYKMLGVGLTKKVIRETKALVGESWKWVKSVDFPGKQVLVIMYPKGLLSVVDYALNTTWYLTTLTGKTVIAAKAWALYAALKTVSSAIGPAMRAIHLDCVLLRGGKVTLDNPLIEEIQIGPGRVCGWPNLVPVNNVTITKDSVSFLVVEVPYVLRHLDINFKDVSVKAMGDTVINKEKMHVHVNKVHVQGKISFRAGTILSFISIKIRVGGMDGFSIDFGRDTDKTIIMDTLESMGDVISAQVTKTVNQNFIKFENQISKLIKG